MPIPDLSQLEIAWISPGLIKPYAKNPREHPRSQIDMLKAGISRFGFVGPMLLTPDRDLIAGHGRLIAATELKLDTVPVIVLPHLNEAEVRALRIADNAISAKGEWSADLLAEELNFTIDGDFGLGALELGFEQGEIDFYLGGGGGNKKKVPNHAVHSPDRAIPSVTRRGDEWLIGNHRILCADSTNAASFDQLLRGELADLVMSDMPWNVRVNGHVGGSGAVKHPEFAMASGEMSEEEFRGFIKTALDLNARFSRPGALNYQWIDWRGVGDMIAIGKQVYDALLNVCVWVKPNGGMGSLYRSRHEFACVFRVQGGRHDNFVNLGKHGRNRTNVWEFAAPSGLGAERENLALHPTCKNAEMIGEAIMDSTRRKAVVLDPFLGSGTTLLAAHRTGRWGRGIEIDPYYVDVAVRRLQAETGLIARLADGATFQDIEGERKDQTHDQA